MSQQFRWFGAAIVAGLWLVLAHANAVEAQAFGVGPRFSFVRGDLKAGSSTRYSGAMLRLRTSPRSAIELSLDYRNHLNESLTERIKDYPLQGSLLLYPVRTTFSPYLVTGIGLYSQRIEGLQDNHVLTSTKTRKTGYHAGLGADLRLGGHATVHADYRYTFLGFGRDEGSEPGALPIPGFGGLQDRLKLSHKGSMWTTGVTVYF
jgi:opacity protein-like surface antigen